MPRPKGPTLTRGSIVEAAIAVIRSEGEAALGINRVARQLGIQPPSMYNHVAGNDALYRLVALEGWQAFLTAAKAALKMDMDSRAQLLAIAMSYRQCAKQNPELLAIAASHRMNLEDSEFSQLYNGIVQLYAAALRPWGFSDTEIIHTARMLNAAFCGYAQLENKAIFQQSLSLDETYDWMILRLIQSLESIVRTNY